jgi:hypothetical protein
LEPYGRRHAAAVERVFHLRASLQQSIGHDVYLIAAKSTDGIKVDIDNVRAEVRF